MKKRTLSLLLALTLVVSMFTVFAVPTSAYDLSGCTVATDPFDIELATANITNLLQTSGGNDGNSLGYRFGFFWDYYSRITLPKYQALAPVVDLKNHLDMTLAMLDAYKADGTVYLPEYYEEGTNEDPSTLQGAWHAARMVCPVNNGLQTMRNEKLTETFPAVEGEEYTGWNAWMALGFSPIYDEESWKTFLTYLAEGDELSKAGNDAEGDAYLARFDEEVGKLVERTDPINIENYKLWKALPILSETFISLLNKFTLDASRATPEYQALEDILINDDYCLDFMSIEDYDNDFDYTTLSESVLEQYWFDARAKAYIGPVLQTIRNELFATVLPEESYTPESWAAWMEVKQDLSDAIDNTKNNVRAKDKDGLAAVNNIKDAIAALVPVNPKAPTPAAPVIESKTADSINLTAVAGAEYGIRKDGETSVAWQSSTTFVSLEAGVTYYFSVRILATDTTSASDASAETSAALTIKGDFNGNGEVDLADAMSAFMMVAGKTEITKAALDVFDFNADGKISLVESMKIFLFVAEKIDTLA